MGAIDLEAVHAVELDMLKAVADTNVEYIAWGDALNKDQRKAAQSTIQHHVAVLGYVLQQLDRHHQNELVDTYYPVYASHANER